MHTFRNYGDKYAIGQWISAGADASWEGILTCPTIFDAIRAVNALNGGAATFTFMGDKQPITITVPGKNLAAL